MLGYRRRGCIHSTVELSVLYFLLIWLRIATCSGLSQFTQHATRRDVVLAPLLPSLLGTSSTSSSSIQHPFHYSPEWSGTCLDQLSLEEAVDCEYWPMARWPDPILRCPAEPIDIQQHQQQHNRINAISRASHLLQRAAREAKAVGLAAQQCGINARMVYLRLPQNRDVTMINPRILQRSPERDMRVWTESCLVLPPTFTATVLRDAWVRVTYQHHTTGQQQHEMRLWGETARALQHEMDHDRGLLVTDHVDLSELENDTMRRIESPRHIERMQQAYSRYLY